MTRNCNNEPAGYFERNEDAGYNFDITPMTYLDRSLWKERHRHFDLFGELHMSPALKLDVDPEKRSDSIKGGSPHPFWDSCYENVIQMLADHKDNDLAHTLQMRKQMFSTKEQISTHDTPL